MVYKTWFYGGGAKSARLSWVSAKSARRDFFSCQICTRRFLIINERVVVPKHVNPVGKVTRGTGTGTSGTKSTCSPNFLPPTFFPAFFPSFEYYCGCYNFGGSGGGHRGKCFDGRCVIGDNWRLFL